MYVCTVCMRVCMYVSDAPSCAWKQNPSEIPMHPLAVDLLRMQKSAKTFII